MSEKLKVPDEWCCVNHIDIAEINPKFDINQFKEDVEVSFLPMASVKEISGNYDLSQSRKLSAVKKGYTNFKNGDIIFAKITPCMENGKIAVLDNLLNGMGFGSTEFHVSRPYHDINAQFLFYYFVQSAFRKKAQRIMTGSAGQLRVSTEYFKKVNIPIPPLPEQRAIVSKVEQLFSDLDNGIDNFKKAQKQLKRYRQSVLKAACEGKLVPTEAKLAHSEGRDYEPADVLLARILEERREKWNGKGKYKEPAALDTNDLWELPEGWGWATLEQYAFEVKDGTHDSPKYQESGIHFVTQKNIKKNGFDFSNTNKITNEDHNKFYRRSNPESGDILISMIGANRGMSCIVNVETVFSIKNVGLVKSYKQFNIFKFIDYYMKSQVGQRLILDKSKGGAQEFIGLTELRSWPISVPPLTEQRRIVFEVERRLSLCDKMEATIAESLKKAESLRQSILKKAFEGKLLSEKELEEARNAPDWEPAEKLLERIKAEKTNIKTKNKGKK
jgi:type I restriction enzyme S subunit